MGVVGQEGQIAGSGRDRRGMAGIQMAGNEGMVGARRAKWHGGGGAGGDIREPDGAGSVGARRARWQDVGGPDGSSQGPMG